jgi:hypothetical protein
LMQRLDVARVWVALQFGLTLVLIVAGLAWTRLPEKHVWEVVLSLLVPLVLAICALELQAGTIRKLADDDDRRVKLVWGAVTLVVWVAVGAAFWVFLDWCDDRIPLWAGYLNSKAPAGGRATWFTYAHIYNGLGYVEWVLRWIVLPAKLIPYGVASAQWGWRIPWMRVLRMLWNWRWWVVVVAAALVAVWLPGRFFVAEPNGTVSAQVWHVGLKLAATYVLAVGCWVLLLAWVAMLFGRQRPRPDADDQLARVTVAVGPPGFSRGAAAEVPPGDDEEVN